METKQNSQAGGGKFRIWMSSNLHGRSLKYKGQFKDFCSKYTNIHTNTHTHTHTHTHTEFPRKTSVQWIYDREEYRIQAWSGVIWWFKDSTYTLCAHTHTLTHSHTHTHTHTPSHTHTHTHTHD